MASKFTQNQRKKEKELLKQKGLWTDYVNYREALKQDGVPAAEARQQALAKYLPEKGFSSPADDGGESDSTPRQSAGDKSADAALSVHNNCQDEPVEPRRLLNWVLSYLFCEDVTPDMAPNRESWSVLHAIRKGGMEAQQEFVKTWMQYNKPSKKEQEREGFEDDNRKTLSVITKLEQAIQQAKIKEMRKRKPA
jgi:hypothetical protein